MMLKSADEVREYLVDLATYLAEDDYWCYRRSDACRLFGWEYKPSHYLEMLGVIMDALRVGTTGICFA